MPRAADPAPPVADDLRALLVPLEELHLLPGNPRRGDVDAVAASLARFGQRKPIVAGRDGMVIAGNHTLQAARQLGWSHLAVVRVDDDEVTAKAFALADNRTADLGAYDDPALLEMIRDVGDVDAALLAAAGWSNDAVAALVADIDAHATELPPALADPDAAPDVPAEPVTQPGDVWLLGRHRVLCGDATDVAAVEAMLAGDRADCMWTDPPYGVDYVGKTKEALTITNDGAKGLPDLLAGAFATATVALKPGSPVYVAAPPGPLSLVFGEAIQRAGWSLRQQLVWVKNSLVLGHNDYHYRHEPIWMAYTDGGAGQRGRGGPSWHGDDSQTTVFEVARPSRSTEHPTMKPVELVAAMLRNSCARDGLVYDPFGGSGSTLIAAHQLAMRAALVELDPRYVDVICRRWQEATGDKPVLAATGQPHDFAA